MAWKQLARVAALTAVCAAACDTVLDIEEPKMRPGSAGEAGEQAGGAPNSGGSVNMNVPMAGDAGAPLGGVGATGAAASEGGAAGEGAAAGEGGTGGAPECEADAVRCAGSAEKSPEICDASGHWTANTTEADGDCAVLCADGKCTECKDADKRCSVCDEADASCSTNQPQNCVNGAWQDDGIECKTYCDAGACVTPPSCPASESRAVCESGESCCRSLLVPGGTFKRNYDGGDYFNDPSFPAQVSPFALDKFEVTVGRMRSFVAFFSQLDLKDGQGKSDHVAGDKGWSTKLDLPLDTNALITQLKCLGTTWSDSVGDNDQLPINCTTFAVAYAFCIWDGGRLPTETEWNFAATGGDEQRAYPWKPPASDPKITDEYAFYFADGRVLPTTVGSRSKGNGRYGQADLAGNVSEWALDYYSDPLLPELCADCVSATASPERSIRGGAFSMVDLYQLVSFRSHGDPNVPIADLGFRCAHDLK